MSQVRSGIMALAIGMAGVASPETLCAQELPVTYQAFAVNLGAHGPKTSQLQITIERWSTDEERDKVRDAVQEKGGGDALLGTIQKIKPRAGFIRTSNSIGWNIQYARLTEMEGGTRRVVIVTDRPMSFGEVSNQTRSSDYQFMLAELRIKADGKGEGKLVPRAKVQIDKDDNTLVIENYDQLPVRLTQVVETTKTKK